MVLYSYCSSDRTGQSPVPAGGLQKNVWGVNTHIFINIGSFVSPAKDFWADRSGKWSFRSYLALYFSRTQNPSSPFSHNGGRRRGMRAIVNEFHLWNLLYLDNLFL